MRGLRLATSGFEGANIRLMRWELQAALPPKWSTASRTDLKGAEVSTSALPSRPPAAAEAPGWASSCASASPFMGTRAASKDSSFLGSVRGVLVGVGGARRGRPTTERAKESKPVEASTARLVRFRDREREWDFWMDFPLFNPG